MEKVDAGMIEEYRGIEDELNAQRGNFKSLQECLSASEINLSKSRKALKDAEAFQDSDDLLSLADVEGSRKNTQKIQRKTADLERVTQNQERAAKNINGSIIKLGERKRFVMQKIWKELARITLEEIEKKVGGEVRRYLVATKCGNPDLTPHRLPGRLGEILSHPEEMKELKSKITDEIFN